MKKLEKFTGGDRAVRRKLNALVDAVNSLTGIKGDGYIQVADTVDGPKLRLSLNKLIPKIPKKYGFWAKITGNDGDPSGDHRWKYAWEEVRKTKTGYPATPGTVDNWETFTNARSGTTTVDPAYHTIENMNNATDAHVEGNGVDPANLDPADTGADTFEFMPYTIDNIVWMREVVFTVDVPPVTAYIEYWFNKNTGIDGGCS